MDKKLEELFSVFDYIDEIIYICDMNTYDLIYCNKKLKEKLLVDGEEKIKESKCYKCLQGLEYPCVFCNNDELKNRKVCIWSRQNQNDGKYYLLHDSIITIDGKDYRMELAVDASHLEKAEAHTRKMLEMETYLTDCLRHLVKAGNFGESVDAVLQTILNYYNGDRAYLFEFDWENNVSNNTFEICAPGVIAEKDNLQKVPIEKMVFWTAYFEKQSAIIIENIEDLKSNPKRKTEYEDLSAQNISSLIAMPIFTDDKLTGFIGVDNAKQNFEKKDLLKNLAYFLGVEINRNHVVLELKDMSFTDALTGVYNRKGFEQVVENMIDDDRQIGFAVIDIDNFKTINDSFGHDFGDEILKETADILSELFGKEDTIFRLGGDEFAVLFSNWNKETWNALCSKVQWIHSEMAEKHKDMSITLSVGVCVSKREYSKKIYKLADEALYETKRNGRAGCTFVDENTGKKKRWKDNNLSTYSKNVLEFNSTGLFKIEYPTKKHNKARMICSDITKEIFAIPSDTDPEDCYKMWHDRIDPQYMSVLNETKETLLSGMQAECTYIWNHPIYGKIYVRTSGTGEAVNGAQVLYGYHHSLKDTKIIEKKDDTQLLIESISSIYFGTYYIDLEKDSYIPIKKSPYEKYVKVEEGKAEERLKHFVNELVAPYDREKMAEFLDLSTINHRLEKEVHLDCEYKSLAEDNWCRASFFPVMRDENGKITHVLFAFTVLDAGKSAEAEENKNNKKTIESLYNNVPGGLVMYEWDGTEIKLIQASKFFEEQYKLPVGKLIENVDSMNEVYHMHPDDYDEFHKSIINSLDNQESFEYVYRAWNMKKEKYVWVKLNAVSKRQPDGKNLIYALYSDVTGQKEAELNLKKNQASLVAALGASNQLCYEYDPKTHVEVCLTEDTVFHLPKVIENYPGAMLELVHPEDRETFLSTIQAIDDGKKEATCNIRLKRDDKYVWYSYHLQSFYDTKKERIIIIMSIIDNSEHVATIQNYEAGMQMMMSATNDALSFGTINITANTFKLMHANEKISSIAASVNSLDELFNKTVLNVIGEEQQRQYKKEFSRENFIKNIENGNMHIEMEHLYRMSEMHIELVCTCVEMLKNPITGDYVGVCYSKSVQNERITNILLGKTLKRDYPFAAVLYVDSDEYYLYDADNNELCANKKYFWTNIKKDLSGKFDEETLNRIKDNLTKEKILSCLNNNKEFYYAFDSVFYGKKSRLEIKFNYIDDVKEMILATIRDITDSVIMQRLIHDNERDYLTNLYNRRKTFKECRRLIDEHPEDQFAMLHFDIKRFKLYNTFFGDAAGDKLLCDIADMFRKMDSDYEYWTYGRIDSDVFSVCFPINHNKYQKHLDDLLNGLQDYRSDFLIEPAIGIYIITDKNMSIESMFARASIAAKTVKSGVTNSIIFYDEHMEQRMLDERQVVNEMQTAIEKEQFEVYLQPKYSLDTKKTAGAEALVRWIHPVKGLLSPAKFIPVFESNGFIANLDRYMWEHVCQLLKTWMDKGYEVEPVSVNVSRISMYSATTVPFLKELVNRYDIDPKYLELELTETAYMDDPEEMKKELEELQKFGFKILMDDFGSGYSSLNTLKELPVDCLKLDMRFLSESCTDERGRAVLSSVVNMSKLLKLTIIAEGVETKAQADFLSELGCEYAQGYLFAKPMSVEMYEKIIKK